MNLKSFARFIFKLLLIVLGAIIGYLLFSQLQVFELFNFDNSTVNFIIQLIFVLIFAIILYFLSDRIIEFVINLVEALEKELVEMPLSQVILGTLGLIIGLLIASLIGQLISSLRIGIIGSFVSLIIYVIFPYLGMSIAAKNTNNVLSLFKDDRFRITYPRNSNKDDIFSSKKVLDTSVIIDGRIYEITKTGFVEGEYIMPTFVLEELQHIADNSDSLKRNRGRRGLEVVNELKELDNIKFTVDEIDYPEIAEVDSKLVRYAQDNKAMIMTNDYNLNKVASVQGIEVLNINELANALKPIAIPGESMTIEIIKEGQEKGQGVGYLDDGTMIVVEDGKPAIGETREVIVTSVLQTNAGKMIFTRLS